MHKRLLRTSLIVLGCLAIAGCGSMTELTMRTGAGACCGSCVDTAAELLASETAARKVVHELPLACAA